MSLVQFDNDLAVPDWLRKHVVGVNIISIQRPSFPYIPFLIVSKKLSELTGFVSYNNGLAFISEEVPKDFREFFILHEFIEFEELKGVQGACLESLKRELHLVPPDKQKNYINYRKVFFQLLVGYYKERAGTVTPQFRSEIESSL